MSLHIDDNRIPFVWVGAGVITGICHLLVRDIAFRALDKIIVENLSDILTEEIGPHVTIRFTEDWCCAVIQVRMEDDMGKIRTFIEDNITMHERVLVVCDWNKTYETEIPAMLAAPGTICPRRRTSSGSGSVAGSFCS